MAIQGFDLESFTASFDGGARSYLFLYAPNIPGASADVKYLVRASSFPETTLEEIMANWQGQDMKFAAKKTFTDWTLTFNVDLEAQIRQYFEDWTNMIHHTLKETNKFYKPSEYYRDQVLSLLDLNGDFLLDIKLINAWPKSIGAITLDYSSTDVAQFDVTFGYNQHEIYKP